MTGLLKIISSILVISSILTAFYFYQPKLRLHEFQSNFTINQKAKTPAKIPKPCTITTVVGGRLANRISEYIAGFLATRVLQRDRDEYCISEVWLYFSLIAFVRTHVLRFIKGTFQMLSPLFRRLNTKTVLNNADYSNLRKKAVGRLPRSFQAVGALENMRGQSVDIQSVPVMIELHGQYLKEIKEELELTKE